MLYKKFDDKIEVCDKSQFNPEHILECGQVFCFDKQEENYVVFPEDKFAKIVEKENCYQILTETPDYFENYFDLKTDYSKIKNSLSSIEILKNPLEFGYGIRILKQNLFETLISFIISANNNIKRIKLILNNLRKAFENDNKRKSFPSRAQLLSKDEEFFKQAGCGYRASYLYKVLRQIDEQTLENYQSLDTKSLREKLIDLAGVGPKVADCVLLFGFGRGDVFPVDTWIKQMYNQFYQPLENREQIRNNLINQFGVLSGYAQQYLFYYQRSFIKK